MGFPPGLIEISVVVRSTAAQREERLRTPPLRGRKALTLYPHKSGGTLLALPTASAGEQLRQALADGVPPAVALILGFIVLVTPPPLDHPKADPPGRTVLPEIPSCWAPLDE